MDSFDFKGGRTYVVIKAFNDFDDSRFEVGQRLTFIRQTYFHYDGGNTFYFKERGMRLAEISVSDSEILRNMSQYFRELVIDQWSRLKPGKKKKTVRKSRP